MNRQTQFYFSEYVISIIQYTRNIASINLNPTTYEFFFFFFSFHFIYFRDLNFEINSNSSFVDF